MEEESGLEHALYALFSSALHLACRYDPQPHPRQGERNLISYLRNAIYNGAPWLEYEELPYAIDI
jgi:hypothetical protein